MNEASSAGRHLGRGRDSDFNTKYLGVSFVFMFGIFGCY